jgi:prevent-host-death family protein
MMRETGRCGARGPRLPQLLDKLVEATSLNGMKSQPVLVGAFEAKTKLGNLLERVGRGASFIITKHDQPVARLTSYRDDKKARRKTVVAELRALRKKYNLNGISIRELRDEGRA